MLFNDPFSLVRQIALKENDEILCVGQHRTNRKLNLYLIRWKEEAIRQFKLSRKRVYEINLACNKITRSIY